MPREAMPTLQELLPKSAKAPKRQGAKASSDGREGPAEVAEGEEAKVRRTLYVPMGLDYRISQAHVEARRLEPGLSWSDWVTQLCEKGLEVLEAE